MPNSSVNSLVPNQLPEKSAARGAAEKTGRHPRPAPNRAAQPSVDHRPIAQQMTQLATIASAAKPQPQRGSTAVIQRFPDTPEEEAALKARAALINRNKAHGLDISPLLGKPDPEVMKAKILRMQQARAALQAGPPPLLRAPAMVPRLSPTKASGYGRADVPIFKPPPQSLADFFSGAQDDPSTLAAAITGKATADRKGLPAPHDAPDKLLQEAEAHFKSTALPGEKGPGIAPKKSDLYQHNLTVAESHADVRPKRFLVENMPAFRKAGFSTLFMEHLMTDQHSALLDEYYADKSPAPEMPAKLAEYLDALSHGQAGFGGKVHPKFNYRAVVEAARTHGVRVVPIDTTLSYKARDFAKGPPRRKAMNYVGAKIISAYQNHMMGKGEKWVAFMGDGHARTNDAAPGVSELLGARDVAIHDDKDARAPKWEANGVHDYGEDGQTRASYMIHAGPDQSLALPPPGGG